MPTTATITYTGSPLRPMHYPEQATTRPARLKASVTYAKGDVLGELTATPGTYAKYDSGGVDGSETPKALLPFACVTDASGNITIGAAAGGGEFGETYDETWVYTGGHFKTADVPLMTQAILDAMNGLLYSGTFAGGGIFKF